MLMTWVGLRRRQYDRRKWLWPSWFAPRSQSTEEPGQAESYFLNPGLHMRMMVVDLAAQPRPVLEAAAKLLLSEFEAPSGWSSMDAAQAEVARILQDGIAR